MHWGHMDPGASGALHVHTEDIERHADHLGYEKARRRLKASQNRDTL